MPKTQSDPPPIGFSAKLVYNYIMSPRHFSKQMFSPYFQSEHYKNESNEFRMQDKIEGFIKKLCRLFFLKRK